MDAEIIKGNNINDFMSDSEDSFADKFVNTRGNPANRQTKYKPPEFLFDDK
jgi:hypothetical protein